MRKGTFLCLCMITRLANQKGMDILAGAMESLMERDIQFVILGTGRKGIRGYVQILRGSLERQSLFMHSF